MKSTPLKNVTGSAVVKDSVTVPQIIAAGDTMLNHDDIKKQDTPLPAEPGHGKKKPFPVVAIGASAGGLEAVTELLQNLSPHTGMAFIYVQHLSPDHKSMLTSLLSKVTTMKVQDIEDMEKMEPDNVYVIPYNKDIEVTNGHIKLIPRQLNKFSNLSIDILFSSLALTHKENVIGIVLSGSANDGTRGLREIKQAGGITFAQDESAKFSSMPQSAIAEGVVDFVLSPKDIAYELVSISKNPLARKKVIKSVAKDEIANSDPDFQIILHLLNKNKSVDFSHYKMSTIKRRIVRKMLILKIKNLKQFAGLLEQNNNELDLLYRDLLINVTGFFRDTEAFQLLKKSILPRLLKSKAPGEMLRIWVAACATGEEVYSIAMMLSEIQEESGITTPFQIFASDLSLEAINEARVGEYTMHQLKNVSAQRLHHFFTKLKDKYRISKDLRDRCVFAQHNILSDPPFSRIDFISCRNMLIYFDAAAQRKAIATFHYSLIDEGCLMLGKSETIGTTAQLFNTINEKYKIYSRKKNSGTNRIPGMASLISYSNMSDQNSFTSANAPRKIASTNGNLGSAFDAILMAQYMPASVIINHNLEILQFRGSTSMYLQHSSGRANFNILKMAHIGIAFELRNAIHHAIKTDQTVRKTGIKINVGDTAHIVNLEVMPLEVEGEEPLLVVVFTGRQVEKEEHSPESSDNISLAKDRRIKKLEAELAAARADMDSITRDQEVVNEELQSANEEIVSSNEELQSLNEELETSKEEIESTNEELTTSNQELNVRIRQVEELYNYNEVILATVHEPMLILDKNIRIKSVNEAFCKTFHVTAQQSIGLSLFKLGNNQWNILRLRELLEDIVPKNMRFHDFEVEHTFPVIGHKIMLLNAHRIVQKSLNEELIVLTISDITEVKRLAIELQEKEKKELQVQLEQEKKALKKIEDSNTRYNMLLLQSPFAIAILKGKKMIIKLANDRIKEMWGKGEDVEGQSLLTILPENAKHQYAELLKNVYTTGVPFYAYELYAPLKRNGVTVDAYFNYVYQPYREADDTISGITIIAYEVTAQVNAKNELIEAKNLAEHGKHLAEVAVKAKQQFLSNMSHEIRTPMNAIIGFTNVVLKTKLDESQKDYLNAIKVSGDALIVLINDILDLARVDAGKMTFEQIPFNFSASIGSMLHLFEAKIKEKNLVLVEEYDPSIPQTLVGDPMRLRQIILNLVSNAVKFTNKGKITMLVRLLQEDAEKATIEFTLTDTGIGIPADRLEQIFNNFEQVARDASSSYGGSGLGLAIVKQFVELQGGTIIVKSELGKGSTFGFELSFAKLKPKEEIANPDPKMPVIKDILAETPLKNIKVLVVEDIRLNQLLIKILLLEFGCEIDIADNGQIAIENLKEKEYDIILMDLQMPVMNGFEATAHIRNIMNSQIPIIALTADVTAVDVERCKAFGMNDYISKPIDENLLYAKIVKVLNKTRRQTIPSI